MIPSEDLPKLKAVAELFLQAIGQGHRVGMEQLATIPAPMGRMRVLAKRCDEKLRLELGAPEFQLPLKHLIFDIRMVEELHKELDVIIKVRYLRL